MKSFRELRVWQAAMDLVETVYLLTHEFPKYEIYALATQLQRAAVSMTSNIAEGHTREHLKDYLYHLLVAQASLAEVETQLEISLRLKDLVPQQLEWASKSISSLRRQLYALRNALMRHS